MYSIKSGIPSKVDPELLAEIQIEFPFFISKNLPRCPAINRTNVCSNAFETIIWGMNIRSIYFKCFQFSHLTHWIGFRSILRQLIQNDVQKFYLFLKLIVKTIPMD